MFRDLINFHLFSNKLLKGNWSTWRRMAVEGSTMKPSVLLVHLLNSRSGLPYVLCYIDDLLLTGCTEQ